MSSFDDYKKKGLLTSREFSAYRNYEHERSLRDRSEIDNQLHIDKINRDAENRSHLIKLASRAGERDLVAQLEIEQGLGMENHAMLTGRAAHLAAPRLNRAQKAFETSIRTATGTRAIKEDIAAAQYSSGVFPQAMSLARGATSRQLEEARAATWLDLEQTNKNLLSASSNIGTSDGRKMFEAAAAKKHELTNQLGLESRALQENKKLGLDSASRYHDVNKLYTGIAAERGIGEARAGATGSLSSTENALEKAKTNFIKTMEELNSAASKTGEEFEELQAKASIAGDEVKKLGTQADELRRRDEKRAQMVASGFGGAATVAGAGASIISGAATMARQWGQQTLLDTAAVQTQIQGAANERYFTSFKASQGDAMSILKTKRASYQKATLLGENIGAMDVESAREFSKGGVVGTGANILNALASGAQGYAKGGSIGGVIGVAGGIGSTMSSATQVSGIQAGLESGVTKAAGTMQGYNASMALSEAQLAVPAFLLDNAIGFTRNSVKAASGSGGNKASLMNHMRDPGNMQALAGLGLTQADQLGLLQSGISSLGGQFKASDITRAGTVERQGLLSGQQYMGLRGSMSGTGGSDRNLETILRNAVTTGMDNSKNISEMVQGITGLSARQSSGGISTFAGTMAGSLAGIQALREAGVSKNMAAAAAMNIQQTQNSIMSTRNIDIPSMVQSAELYSKLGLKAGSRSGEAVARMTPAQLKQVAAVFKNPKATRDQKQQAMIDVGGGDWWNERNGNISYDDIKTVGGIATTKQLSQQSQMFAWSKEDADLLAKYAKNGRSSISNDEFKRLDSAWKGSLQAQGKELSPLAAWEASSSVSASIAQGKNKDTIGDHGQRMNEAAASGEANVYAEAMKQLGGKLDKVVDAMVANSKQLDPERIDAVSKATNSGLDNSISRLTTTLDNFAGTVASLNGKLGGSPAPKMSLDENVNPAQAKPGSPAHKKYQKDKLLDGLSEIR